jgi:hypothetical protein
MGNQGVQGELITFAPDYDHTDEVQRLRGVRWKIDPSLGELHFVMRS